MNTAFKFQTATLNGDSIHLNSTMSFSSSTDAIQNSHVDMANGSALSIQNASTSGSVFPLAGNAAIAALLLHTEGNGQTQYPVRIPSRVSGAIVVQTVADGVTRSSTVLVR